MVYTPGIASIFWALLIADQLYSRPDIPDTKSQCVKTLSLGTKSCSAVRTISPFPLSHGAVKIDNDDIKPVVSFHSPIMFACSQPTGLLACYRYLMLYDKDNNNQDVGPIHREGSWKWQKVEYIWREHAVETNTNNMQMTTSLGGQLTVKQTIRNNSVIQLQRSWIISLAHHFAKDYLVIAQNCNGMDL